MALFLDDNCALCTLLETRGPIETKAWRDDSDAFEARVRVLELKQTAIARVHVCDLMDTSYLRAAGSGVPAPRCRRPSWCGMVWYGGPPTPWTASMVWYGMVPLLPPGPQLLRPGGGSWIRRRLSMLRLSPFRPSYSAPACPPPPLSCGPQRVRVSKRTRPQRSTGG
jgi:hypothetical protein